VLKSPTTLTRCASGAQTAKAFRHAIDLAQVRAETLEGPQVRAFGEQPDVHFAENGRETIRIIGLLYAVPS
jgi:hypothetical protein